VKILFTTFTFAPDRNGVAEVVGAQANGLAHRGHDVTVATAYNKSRMYDGTPRVRIAEFRIPSHLHRPGTAEEFHELRRYRKFLADFECDVIISHCWRAWPTDFALAALSRHRARKVFVSHGYTAHRWFPRRAAGWGLGNWLRGLPYIFQTFRALRVYDHIVFLSPRADWNRFFDRRLVDWFGRPPASAIPNGTYPEQFKHPPQLFRHQFGIRDFLVLCVSSYLPDKNQELVLRAFLRANLPPATLVFIGPEFNQYTEWLQKLARQRNGEPSLRRVLFLEKQSPEMIRAAYRAADLFALSSKGETQPLVILDAMAAGLAFLSTDVGCVSEFPGGEIANSEKHMSELMARLASDAKWRKELGEDGLQAVATRYNWSRVLDQYDTLLTTLASKTSLP
jgi:glycosyltransferase involved in cell wall biosynthesis